MTKLSFSGLVINDNSMVLPQAPLEQNDPLYFDIYRKFMEHVRYVPVSRMEIKILSAIQFTADTLDLSDAIVSKMLVEMGMRAPRISFPTEFLDYADAALMRIGWSVGAPSDDLLALQRLWFSMQKESQGLTFRHVHTVLEQELMRV